MACRDTRNYYSNLAQCPPPPSPPPPSPRLSTVACKCLASYVLDGGTFQGCLGTGWCLVASDCSAYSGLAGSRSSPANQKWAFCSMSGSTGTVAPPPPPPPRASSARCYLPASGSSSSYTVSYDQSCSSCKQSCATTASCSNFWLGSTDCVANPASCPRFVWNNYILILSLTSDVSSCNH